MPVTSKPSTIRDHVYISFSRKDRVFVERLVSRLQKEGIPTWVDIENIKVGQAWDEEIANATQTAIAMILVISSTMLESSYIRENDIPRAIQANIPILPLLIEDVLFDRIPPEIAKLQYLDFRQAMDDPKTFEVQFASLIQALQQLFSDLQSIIELDSEVFKSEIEDEENLVQKRSPQSAEGVELKPPTEGNNENINSPNVPPTSVSPQASAPPVIRLDPKTLIRTLTDEPTVHDLLGFQVYALVLVEFIKNHRDKMRTQEGGRKQVTKPLSICIDAQWGAGKTSLMQMIKAQLETTDTVEKQFNIVWFNAWQYNKEDSLWAALALQVEAQITTDRRRLGRLHLLLRRLQWERLLERMVMDMLRFLLLLVMGVIALLIAPQVALPEDMEQALQFLAGLFSIGGLIGLISLAATTFYLGRNIRDQLFKSFDFKISDYIRQPNYADRVDFLTQFKRDFSELVKEQTRDGAEPLVVFIDDLDRCTPTKTSQIIEAISLVLDSEYCIYVMGMDSRTVAAAIETNYKDLEKFLDEEKEVGGISFGEKFLEKIVQINFKIPRISPEVAAAFIAQTLTTTAGTPQTLGGTAQGESPDTDVPEGEAIGVDFQGIEREQVREFLEAFENRQDVIEATREAAQFLGFNPRKIKRFLNEFRLSAAICERRHLLHTVINLRILARWIILETRYPDLINILRETPEFASRLLEASNLQTSFDVPASKSKQRVKVDQEQLEALQKDERIGRFIAARDMIALMERIKSVDAKLIEQPEFIRTYLFLVEVKPEQSVL